MPPNQPKNFWDILKQTYGAASEYKRVRDQLQNIQQGVQPVQNIPVLQPPSSLPEPTLVQKQREEVQRLEQQKALEEQEEKRRVEKELETANILDIQKKKEIIGIAARSRRRLEIQYNGMSRKVDAYSYRIKDDFVQNGKIRTYLGKKEMFYGKCSICGRINSFDLRKIQKVKVLDELYEPSLGDVEIE